MYLCGAAWLARSIGVSAADAVELGVALPRRRRHQGGGRWQPRAEYLERVRTYQGEQAASTADSTDAVGYALRDRIGRIL